jgi:hypothetical protein
MRIFPDGDQLNNNQARRNHPGPTSSRNALTGRTQRICASGRPSPMERAATMRRTSKESESMSNLMFAPMSQRLAEAGERDRKERAERLEAERIEREAAQAREKSREQEDAEFAQKIAATSAEAVAKQQAIARANLDKVEREKAERVEEIVLLGKVIAEELKPMFAAQTQAIEKLVSTLKEH